MRQPKLFAPPLGSEEKAWLEEARAARNLPGYKRDPALGPVYVRPAQPIVAPAPDRSAPVRYKRRCLVCCKIVTTTAGPDETPDAEYKCALCLSGGVGAERICCDCPNPLPPKAHPLRKRCAPCTKLRAKRANAAKHKRQRQKAKGAWQPDATQ